MKNLIWIFIRKLRLGGLLLQLHPKSYLRRHGWFTAFNKKRSIDSDSRPIPWWSYGFIDFVIGRLNSEMSVLEFGSGGSTVWLSQRVKQVVSIENDLNWSKIVKSFIPENVQIIETLTPEYLKKEDLPDQEQQFDVLIIDSLAHRINCAKAGLPFLKLEGVVIWDNTDGSDWPEINKLMKSFGFREISFSGVAPQEVAEDRTTVFYRDRNVFGI